MLSRAVACASMRHDVSRVLQYNQNYMQNVVFKRNSGHNTIMVKPSTWDFRYFRNWYHFYFLVAGIPTAVLCIILHIRGNPVLTEVPEGYEPLPWEYEKLPAQRFFAKYLYYPMEREHEAYLGFQEYKAEARILNLLAKRVSTVMKFYNDHRSRYFSPGLGADYIRKGKDEWSGLIETIRAQPADTFEEPYKPGFGTVPTEGFKDGPIE